MKHKSFLLLMVALLTTIATHAYDFQSGDLYYNITSSNTVEVTYQEFLSASNYQGLTTATIPETVTNNGTTYSVTSIGESAFRNCSALTSITIPNSVTSIGDGAFSRCSSLTSITIPNSVTSIGESAFNDVPNIVYSGTATGSPWGARSVNGYVDGYLVYADETKTTLLACSAAATGEVTIPNSVTSIGRSAFIGCSSLTSITIPNSVISIGGSAFYGCSSLTSITIPNSVTSIGGLAFYNCSSLTSITIPNSVTSIGYYAFDGCSALTSVAWNAKNCAGWEYLSYAPFYYICANITSFTFGEEVETIPSDLCYGMSSLTSITIPNSVTSIGDRAFINVPNIVYSGTATGSPWGARSVNGYVDGYLVYADETKTTLLACSAAATGEVTIPNSVTSIAGGAFSGCSSLTSIVVESGNTMYDSRENCNAIIETATNTLIAGCQSTIIPNSVTSIGDDAFWGCSSLTSVTIPNSVTSIGNYAFGGCSSLTSLTLPNSVTSIGDWAFYGCSSLTKTNYTGDIASWCNIQFSNSYANPISFSKNLYLNDVLVTDLVIPQSVIGVGDYAFDNCSSLTSVTIPNSVTTIGNYAFEDCSSLTSITLPNSVTSIGACAFRGCSSLTSVTIPNSVTSIGNYAFYGCSSLTSITLPNSVTSIGEYAFWCCISITSVTIGNSVTSIGDNAFDWCSSLTSVTLGNSVTSIGDNAFAGCSSLTSITIPNSVTSIEYGAFRGCSSLTSVVWNAKNCAGWDSHYYAPFDDISANITSFTFGEEVETIPSYLCYGMTSLTSITIPISVISIGGSAFYGCTSLTKTNYTGDIASWCNMQFTNYPANPVSFSKNLYLNDVLVTDLVIPQGVIGVGDYAFDNCSSLTSVTIPNSVKSIGVSAFYGCSSLTSVTLPDSVTSIGKMAFDNCSSLTSIILPNSVTSIGNSAFYGCSSLTSITIPNSVTSIGGGTFYSCSSLTSITIPNSVTYIGINAFSGCSSLTSITCLATTPPTCNLDCFYDVPSTIPLYVPAECVEAYKAADTWKEFDVQALLSTDATLSSLTYDDMLVPFFEAGTLHYTVDLPSETVAVPVVDAVANDPGATLTIHQATTLPGEASVEVIAEDGTTRQTYTIYFSKKSTPTDISDRPDTAETDSDKGVKKLLRNGQVLIIRNGKTYNMMGQRL